MESSISARIRSFREAKGWTQDDLAEASGLNRVTIAKYESGRIEPKSKTLARLAAALDLTTDALLGSDGVDMTDEEREMWALREQFRNDPDRRALMQLARRGSAQAVRQAAALLDVLKATNPEFYDGDDVP